MFIESNKINKPQTEILSPNSFYLFVVKNCQGLNHCMSNIYACIVGICRNARTICRNVNSYFEKEIKDHSQSCHDKKQNIM